VIVKYAESSSRANGRVLRGGSSALDPRKILFTTRKAQNDSLCSKTFYLCMHYFYLFKETRLFNNTHVVDLLTYIHSTHVYISSIIHYKSVMFYHLKQFTDTLWFSKVIFKNTLNGPLGNVYALCLKNLQAFVGSITLSNPDRFSELFTEWKSTKLQQNVGLV